jgi:hypothetical protein
VRSGRSMSDSLPSYRMSNATYTSCAGVGGHVAAATAVRPWLSGSALSTPQH